jgi:hypothetical protein
MDGGSGYVPNSALGANIFDGSFCDAIQWEMNHEF